MRVNPFFSTYLESKTVTGLGLLLDRVDLEAFFLEAGLGVTVWLSKEVVDDFLLLDRKGVEVNVFKVLDLARFDETSKLGAWGPDLLVSVATTAATAATATSAASAASVASATSAATVATSATSTREEWRTSGKLSKLLAAVREEAGKTARVLHSLPAVFLVVVQEGVRSKIARQC